MRTAQGTQPSPRNALRALVLLVLVLGGFLVALPPAPAQADPARGRMVLVLDSSGSMAEATASGGTRIDAAREGLGRVVDQLPADAQVGMRVYGATVFDKSQPGACEDSQLVVPLGGAENRDALRQAVSAYQPYGETPIGFALRQAAGDVGPAGPRTVVLVSDGEDTCAPPDPCQVAAELRAQGIDLRIDVVGLDVGGDARVQLQCIAEAGGGEYVDAADAGSIAEALETVATRAVRPFELGGQPVDGTPQQAGAPALAPGTYVDELPARGTEVFYAVPRSRPGSTVWASATLQNSTWAGTVYVRTDAGERLCSTKGAIEIGTFRLKDIVSAAAAAWSADPAHPCMTADVVVVRVSTGSDELVGQPFELRISEEPPVTDLAQLPLAPEGGQPWSPMPGGPPGQLAVGGASLGTAVPLQPGLHPLQLVPGETQVFSTTLAWAQRLQAVATVPARGGAIADAAGQVVVTVKVLGPDRGDVVPFRGAPQLPGNGGLAQFDEEVAVAAAETVPVAYLNRASGTGEALSARAGDYLVLVGLAGDAQGGSYVLPATLEVAVLGTPGAPPPYDLPTVTDLVDEPTDDPTDDPTSGATPTRTTEAEAASEGGGLPGWLLPLGLLAIAGAVGATLLALRHRPAGPTA